MMGPPYSKTHRQIKHLPPPQTTHFPSCPLGPTVGAQGCAARRRVSGPPWIARDLLRLRGDGNPSCFRGPVSDPSPPPSPSGPGVDFRGSCGSSPGGRGRRGTRPWPSPSSGLRSWQGIPPPPSRCGAARWWRRCACVYAHMQERILKKKRRR